MSETLICTLAAEANKIQDGVKRAQEGLALIRNRIRSTEIDDESFQRMNKLEDFMAHAGDRIDAIEQYLTTLSPVTIDDALVLAAVATNRSQQRTDEEEEHVCLRSVTRMFAEVTAFLERTAGKPAASLGAHAFGDVIPTWGQMQAEACQRSTANVNAA